MFRRALVVDSMRVSSGSWWGRVGVSQVKREPVRAVQPGANLSGARLAAVDWACADLTHIDFTGADLHSASLVYADFSRATLAWASLRYADLRHADMRSADVTGMAVIGANLTGALLPPPAYMAKVWWSATTTWDPPLARIIARLSEQVSEGIYILNP